MPHHHLLSLLLGLIFFISTPLASKEEPDSEDEIEIKISRRERRELGRMIWHQNHRDIYLNNNKYMKRLQQKNDRGTIIGLELIIAAPTEIRVESRWGHAMMRFVDSESEIGDDVVLGFVAMLDSLQTEHVKGLLGGYPVFPVAKSMRLFNNQYVKAEDRPLDRHVVVTSPKLRKQAVTKTLEMWKHFVELDTRYYAMATTQYRRKAQKRAAKLWGKDAQVEEVKHPESDQLIAFIISKKDSPEVYETVAIHYKPVGHPALGGYTFLSNNCAGALVRFIEHTGLPHRKHIGLAGRIPVKLPVYFDDSLLTPFPVLPGFGLMQLKQDLVSLFKLKKLEDLNDEKSWPADAARLIATKWDLKGQMLLLDALDTLVPDLVRDELVATFPPVADRPTYNDIYQLVSLPKELYSACDDRACINDLNRIAGGVWAPEILEAKKIKMRKYLRSLGDKKIKKILSEDEQYQRHLDLWSTLN